MDISVFGLGYVGAVSAACFAKEGHRVVGVDPQQSKVDLVNQGKSPIIESGLGRLISEAVASDRLRARTDAEEAVRASDASLVCVGTPSQHNGCLDLQYVRNVCADIGEVLRYKDAFHVVVVRSTMLPGTMNSVVIPILEETSGKRAGIEFGVATNPEFLREGTAVQDFYSPPKTVIGEIDRRSGDVVAALYSGVDAPAIRTDIRTAEMVKYTDNVWHALKVCFANEIGNISKALGLDGTRVMELFCRDTKLNLSPYYLKPGFAFGGSCLPKDVRALKYQAKNMDLDVPVLNAILPSNEVQVRKGLRMVLELDRKRVGILGFSFKAGTDDLRESPMVELIEQLLGKGLDLRIYDRNVILASLVGANRDYILNRIPHISRLMVTTLDEVLEHAEVIVVGNGSEEFRSIRDRLCPNQTLLDFVGVVVRDEAPVNYQGICW